MSLRADFDSLSSAKLIEALSIQIYQPPLCSARERLREIAEPLRVPILILDFDTEVTMQGILGFLENSTGLFFAETIEAFEKIGALKTVSVLRAIGDTLKKHGVTTDQLRADFFGTEQYQITSFSKLHGDLGTLPDEIEDNARRLYLHGQPDTAEAVWQLLEAFVENHRVECFDEIARVDAEYKRTRE